MHTGVGVCAVCYSDIKSATSMLPATVVVMRWWHMAQNAIWHHGKCSPPFKSSVRRRKGEGALPGRRPGGSYGCSNCCSTMGRGKGELCKGGSPKMLAWVAYFDSTWMQGDFTNWSRGCVPTGYSLTNNPVEGFNNKIKVVYFNKRVVLPDMLAGCLSMARNTCRDSAAIEVNQKGPTQAGHRVQ